MIDRFDRRISYLRLSVTDRCDLRCFYCMGEDVRFSPKSTILTLEEIERLCVVFIGLGVRKLRLTGGEPLVRRGIMGLIQRLGAYVASGELAELTLTTNGTQLASHAKALAAAGVRRVNVSLDTLSPDLFRRISRNGDLDQVLRGLAAAKDAGLQVKINTVALRGLNESGIDPLIAWCGAQGFHMSLLETMPLGDIGAHRVESYLPLDDLRQRLEQRWTLVPSDHHTGGPARYVTVAETGGTLGFITPMTHDFCSSCNRVRITATGKLYSCLGSQDYTDLRQCLRSATAEQDLRTAITAAMGKKAERHDFIIAPGHSSPSVARHMHVTGG
jgi:GTP 3',8-cyclase